jgi:hypothetical protein
MYKIVQFCNRYYKQQSVHLFGYNNERFASHNLLNHKIKKNGSN